MIEVYQKALLYPSGSNSDKLNIYKSLASMLCKNEKIKEGLDCLN